MGKRHSGEVFACELRPGSEFKILGLPNRATASLSASTQNPAFRPFEKTRRVAQSMIAIRYRNLRRIGI